MQTPNSFSRRLGALLIVAAIALLVALPLLVKGFFLFQMTMVLCMALAVMGLNIVVGFGGQLSLGHGAVFAIGAYVAAVGMDSFALPWLPALVIAGAVCLAFGVLFGWPSLRLKGHHLALATFALALAMPQILKHRSIETWTGGVQGVMVFNSPVPDWLPLSREVFVFYLVLAVVLAAFFGTAALFRSRMGRAIIAVKENQIAAASMGVNVTRTKLATFALSCLLTGLAGALYTLITEYVSPDSFDLMKSILLLVAVMVGGAGTILGPLVGAVFIQFVPNLAEQVSQSATSAIYAGFLLIMVFFMPTGVVGFVRGLLIRLRARR
ncbi:branched-chain amino acid ABC transporter permease [Pararhodobacter zhoushanensis]|uniref:Branched-chain amino acid ABC transporter permease n=1 Tax=Pararhodobacter zhoushanensis TaxID=2479545 RepID=A0ABT3H1J2_9RHOB|nr:branched-chain amino acid ABC transporter permease [Pararhodobacter zhoushanensis]MCW1933568.1 branched-chain amino acid ABC transporter permease [Pararhodobacter zhoushanensis]